MKRFLLAVGLLGFQSLFAVRAKAEFAFEGAVDYLVAHMEEKIPEIFYIKWGTKDSLSYLSLEMRKPSEGKDFLLWVSKRTEYGQFWQTLDCLVVHKGGSTTLTGRLFVDGYGQWLDGEDLNDNQVRAAVIRAANDLETYLAQTSAPAD